MYQRVRSSAIPMVAVALLVLSGCGDSSPSRPTPVPTPTPQPTPVTSTLRQGTFTGLEPNFLLSLPFNVGNIGDLSVQADWTFATNDLDLILTRGTNACANANNQVDFGLCTVVASETSVGPKPERMSVSGLPTGAYTLYIGNRGPERESLSYFVRLTFTPTAGAPDAGLSAVATPFEVGVARQAARPWDDAR